MRLLIIRAGALGDTLMLMPSINQLRGRAEIFFSGRYPGIDYLRPYVDHCIDFESSGWHSLFLNGNNARRKIALPGFDSVAVFFK